MKRWSNIRYKLENEYLAESLRGRITYFATTYTKCHDQEGRAAIRLDGNEVLKSNYFDKMDEHSSFYYHIYNDVDRAKSECWMRAFFEAECNGAFDQRNFYRAFDEFNSQRIDESLKSESLIVRIFAVLDKRCEKRRLLEMLSNTENENPLFLTFLHIRAEAEKIVFIS